MRGQRSGLGSFGGGQLCSARHVDIGKLATYLNAKIVGSGGGIQGDFDSAGAIHQAGDGGGDLPGVEEEHEKHVNHERGEQTASQKAELASSEIVHQREHEQKENESEETPQEVWTD